MQLLLGRLGFMVCGYSVSVVLARGLGPADYAVYGVILSVLVAVEMAGAVGIPGATMQMVPADEDNAGAIVRTANFVLVAVSLLMFAVLWALAPALASVLDIAGGDSLVRLAILDVPLAGLLVAYRGALTAHRKFGLVSLNLVLYGLVKLAGTLGLLALGLSVAGALVVNALASLGAIVILAPRVLARGVRLAPSVAGRLVRIAAPLAAYTVLWNALLGIDLWMLKSIGHEAAATVGMYVAARTIAGVLILVPAALGATLFAWLSKALADADEATARGHIRGAGRFLMIVVVPVVTVVALNAEPLMALAFSSVYAAGALSLVLQAVAFGLLAFLDVFLHAVMAAGRRYQATLALAAVVALAILANVVLVPRLGTVGAGTAFIVTAGGGTIAAALLMARRFRVTLGLTTVARVVVATIVVAAVDAVIATSGPWLLVELGLLGALYATVLALFGELRWRDLDAMVVWRATA
jgi:PST family polysaccharide transporter